MNSSKRVILFTPAHVLSSLAPGASAVDAAREWVYKPTMLYGVPIKVETVLTFTFNPSS